MVLMPAMVLCPSLFSLYLRYSAYLYGSLAIIALPPHIILAVGSPNRSRDDSAVVQC